ncbi:MAG: ribonuclease J [Firmicutes bacterium]|jgi:ribonuclease J|nr:ribonuclease J [Bacillota bacterium]NLO65887.1 ribonuclease J [Bacillota bacterium]
MLKEKNRIRILPLGGLGEIGKNMTLVEIGDDIVVIDVGVMFPEDDMPGVDLVIPDITYLLENAERVKGIFLTHGHEDHIGGVPYVLRKLNVPVYGTKLTLGLLRVKLNEHGLERVADLREITAGQRIQVGNFDIEFIHVNHSIAGVVALAFHTPLGVIVYSSDFKFDQTPYDGRPADFHKFAELGQKGVLCLLSDSTNAERPGYTASEKSVGETFRQLFSNAEGRILVATFASNVHRLQQIFDAAERENRKVSVTGRSMIRVVEVASELGYLDIPAGLLVELDELERLPREQAVIITTGSQGEPMAALSRMAMAEHHRITIEPGDTVIISATPIPGNEKSVGRIINQLFKEGAKVHYEPHLGIHTSGHAQQEELKLLLNLCKPKYFIPIHGEHRMLLKHAELAEATGVPKDNIIIGEIGLPVEFSAEGVRIRDRVQAGQVFVDGLGVGDVGNIVLRDRRQLSTDGIVIVVVTVDRQQGKIVAGPDLVSRGFVYVRESEELMEEARLKAKEALDACMAQNITEWGALKSAIRDSLNRYIWEKNKRRPMILPIIMEI